MDKIYLSVVIPSYNETENLKRGVLNEVRDYLTKQKYTWEVLVVDDESPDLLARKLAKDFCDKNNGFRYVQIKHGGKAVAVYEGVKQAAGEIILFTDMDQSTPIAELEKMLPFFDRGYDVIIGSRGIEREKFSIFRRLASMIFREFRRSLLLTEIIDTQAGFKVFRARVAKELFPLLQVIKHQGSAKGWRVSSFDVELLVAAQERGYKIAEEPILWQDRDVSTGKARGTNKFIKESVDMFLEVWRVKINQIKGLYKK